jgi:CPA2 family monovalent cation:H+ antiporter-2
VLSGLGMDAHALLVAPTIVLGAAAVTAVVFQRLRQPVVLGYILAGFVLGPNVPIPLVAQIERAEIEEV